MLKPFDVSPEFTGTDADPQNLTPILIPVPVSVQNSDLLPHQTTQMMVDPLPPKYNNFFFALTQLLQCLLT